LQASPLLKLESAYAPSPLPKVPVNPLRGKSEGDGEGEGEGEEVGLGEDVEVGEGEEVGSGVLLANTRWLTVVVASRYFA